MDGTNRGAVDPELGINGTAGALAVDRAVGELRRGRCVAITGGGRSFVFAVLETVQAGVLARLLTASAATALILTPERATAAAPDAAHTRPLAIEFHSPADRPALEAYAGLAPAPAALDPEVGAAPWPGSIELVTAGFRLAKAGRLLPALVGFEADTLADASLACVTLAEVERHAGHVSSSLSRTAETRLPLALAEQSRIALFRDEYGGGEHVAVVIGEPDPDSIVPIRLHSACLTGDVLGSLRCDCGEQLRTAVQRIAELGGGVLLYLDQEGRGIGLANKIRAYSIQDTGLDTLDADRHLGFHADERSYDVAAALLNELGIRRVRVLTNNPQKISALREHGIDVVGRLPLVTLANAHNERYLRAKRERAGHLAEEAEAARAAEQLTRR